MAAPTVVAQPAANVNPSFSAQSRPGYASASLYVGDLHPEVNESFLYDTFSSVGPVLSVRICRDAATRRSLKYGYVNYQNYDDAERALQIMNHKDIKGTQCRVMWAQRDPTLRKSGQGNLFIKSLPKTVDSKKLYDLFSVFGNILSAKVATNDKGESNCYGFVHFESDEAAQKAIQEFEGRNVEGSAIHIELFKAARERGTAQRTRMFTNVYVKNVPEEWSQEQFDKYFGQFGKITSSMLSYDEEKKACKGFGFVNYDTVEQANVAVEKSNNAEVGTSAKKLYVSRAQSKDERSRFLTERHEQMRQERNQKSVGTNLFLKNLADNIDDEKLRGIFSKFGNIQSVKVMNDANGRSRGFGFVSFQTPEEATKALAETNGTLVFGKPIYVATAQPRVQRQALLEAQFNNRNKLMQNQMYMGGQNPMAYGRGMMFPQQMRAQWGQPMPMGMMVPSGGGGVGPYQLQPMPGAGGRPQGGMGRGGGQQGVPRMPRGGGAAMRQGGMQGGQQQQVFPGQPTAGPPGQMQQRVGQQQQQQRPGGPAGQRGGRGVQQPGGVNVGTQLLNTSELAQLPEAQAKQLIGERLYPLVLELKGDDAPKITGMLLEMEITDVLGLLESRQELVAKVEEAFDVLKAAQQ